MMRAARRGAERSVQQRDRQAARRWRIFLDGSACTKKYELSSYMVKYIYGGNHSFLVLHDFLEK